MSKLDQTTSKLVDAEFNVSKAELKIADSIAKSTSNKNMLVLVLVALVINLILTISLAGGFISLNNNAARADELEALTSQTLQNTAIIDEAQALAEDYYINGETPVVEIPTGYIEAPTFGSELPNK